MDSWAYLSIHHSHQPLAISHDELVQSFLRSEPDGRPPQGGRKVRTPQGSAPGNARSGQPEGKWHRKYTALRLAPPGLAQGRPAKSALAGPPRANPEGVSREAMVKRCGKSAPRSWQHGWQAKPRTEQGQIGKRQRTARPKLPGRLLDPASNGGARGMIVAAPKPVRAKAGNRIRLTAHCGGLSKDSHTGGCPFYFRG
jgi:hypothetical protein